MNGSDPSLSFVDTNILVYAARQDDATRSPIARDALRQWITKRTLVTSTQVLQECYVTLTGKGAMRLTKTEALLFLDTIATERVFINDWAAMREATGLSASNSISFWDALIVVSARRSGARRLYTEDLKHGHTMLGVEIVNPFLGL